MKELNNENKRFVIAAPVVGGNEYWQVTDRRDDVTVVQVNDKRVPHAGFVARFLRWYLEKRWRVLGDEE